VREAELRQVEVVPRRRQVLGAQADAGVRVAVARRKEVEDVPEPAVVSGRCIALQAPPRPRRQLRPGVGREAPILGQPDLVEHVCVERRCAVEGVVVAFHLTGEEVAGKSDGLRPHRTGGGEVDLSTAMQQGPVVAVGIVDLLDGPLDPLDRAPDEIERQSAAPGCNELRDGVDRRVDAGRPFGRLAIVNVAAGARRLVDRLSKTSEERFVVRADGRCGDVQSRLGR